MKPSQRTLLGLTWWDWLVLLIMCLYVYGAKSARFR